MTPCTTDLFGRPLVDTPAGKQKPVKVNERPATAAPAPAPDAPLRPYTVLKVSRDDTWIFNR